MLTSLLTFNLYLIEISSLGSRNGVLTATYSEVLTLHKHGIDYFKQPLIITDSIQSNWTLLSNLQNLFDENYNISVKKQATNCSCLIQTQIYNKISDKININNLCKHYNEVIIYKRNLTYYLYWDKFEGKHKFSSEGINCINISTIKLPVHQSIKQLLLHNNININISHTENRNIINKIQSYFSLLGFDTKLNTDTHTEKERLQLTELQLNILDHISLYPFFNIFQLNGFKSFKDINNLNIWYASEYYRAIRHFDTLHNLFFVLKGSRKFKISMPTSNIFEMYPFLHGSNRHEIINYPQIDSYEIKDKNSNYIINECTIYENELLYLPGYFNHEVINNNITIVLNIWWLSNDRKYLYDMHQIELPINPKDSYVNIDTFTMHKHGMNGFLYFVQILIEKWCNYVSNHDEKNNYSLRCTHINDYKGFGFLLYNFMSTYKIILNDLIFDNFDWYSIIIDMNNILKCVKKRIIDFNDLIDLRQFMYFCNDIEDSHKRLWNESVNDIMTILYKHTNIGSAEINLIEYLESVLVMAFGDSNIVPIAIKLINL